MSTNSSNNKRIAKNTLLLYVRMIVTMIVSIFTSRVILDSLGAEDFGIYNVVGGFISMFSIFRSGLVTTTQRFITFDLGKNDFRELNNTYITCTIIYIVISIVVFIIAESIGLWFLYNKLVIPENRLSAAFWVFQLSLITLLIGFLSNTQNALIIAHEKMGAFAYISIYEVAVKLAIAYAIYISPFDRLIFYASLMCFLQVSVRLIYSAYCRKKFPESKFTIEFNKEKFKRIFSFTGWAMLGGMSVIFKGQGLNILLNMFFGPVVNAARGVAVQVESAVMGFVRNFQTALNPQIIKLYASQEYNSMFTLVNRSARFSFCLLYIFLLPLFLETDMVLNLWLKEVPDNSAVFIRLLFCISLVDAVTNPIVRVIESSGKIMIDQIFELTITLGVVGLSYLCLSNGGDPYIVYVASLIGSLMLLLSRLFIAKHNASLPIMSFVKDVLLRVLIMAIISSIVPLMIFHNMNDSLIRLLTITFVSVIAVGVSSWFIILSRNEKQFIQSKVRSIIKIKI